MARAIQQRTLETRARLIKAAKEIIDENGFEAMRVEEVVLRAGTAKGTFFAHFTDKDALMDLIIGERIDHHLDTIEERPTPNSPSEIAAVIGPLCEFMTCERYVFDVILRYSGAASHEATGAIAMTFGRQIDLFEKWAKIASFRQDITPELVAEGIQAFMVQTMALKFCELHNSTSISERLEPYLDAWILPGRQSKKS